jgi:hypothetical protein
MDGISEAPGLGITGVESPEVLVEFADEDGSWSADSLAADTVS